MHEFLRTIFKPLLPLFLFSPMAHADTWDAHTEEEALFIRRIADFWQEGEYQIVKKQIEEFLKEYPNSSFAQSLSATLGDLYLREKKFKDALEQYARISDPHIAEGSFLNRMQCLFELQWFATLADECEQFLQKNPADSPTGLRASYLSAIALYQQCLNAANDSEEVRHFAERARPYFQTLFHSELSNEVAQAYAHLCCILKDFDAASKVYLQLAEQTGYNREEMLFQAAVLQAEFDKPLAMKTFDEITRLNGSRLHDALYNQMVLSYDIGEYEDLLGKKKELLQKIPEEKQSSAHLFFGRSHLQLGQYPEALRELLQYAEHASASEALRSALADILTTAYQLEDEASLKIALEQAMRQFPGDPQIPKGMLAHVLLLKKKQQFSEAGEVIEALCSQFAASPEAEAARFEQIHIDFETQQWPSCRSHCRDYLTRFPQNAFAIHVRRYLATAGFHLAAQSTAPAVKEEFINDLERLIKESKSLEASECNEWRFLLAKANYELKHFEVAVPILESLASDTKFSQRANAILLLALCRRDGQNDFEQFCKGAEEALALHANLLDETSLHIALFNGYLALTPQSVDFAAHHLYLASQKTSIEPSHLRWLSDYYRTKSENGECAALFLQRAFETLQQFLSSAQVDIRDLKEETLSFENMVVQFATLQGRLGKTAEQKELLESLKRQQESHPAWAWQKIDETDLLLAMNDAESGQTDRALELFDYILARNPTFRSRASASAALQSAQIRLKCLDQENLSNDDPCVQKILAQLKTLVLQKNLSNEPIHLDAGLEYIDIQTALEPAEKRLEKRLALLLKTEADFESSSDLLSADYQNNRKILPDKDRLLTAYLNLIHAEILLCQSKLAQEASDRVQYEQKAGTVFQSIIAESANRFLVQKAREQMESMKDR